MTVEAAEKEDAPTTATVLKAGWRIKTGFTIFIASIVWPVLLPILPLLGVSSQFVAALTGVMFVVAEVMMIAAAAIAGKEGFTYIKRRIFGFIKSYGPPRVVSAARYKTGLVMFALPLLYAFLSPYIDQYVPGMADHRMVYAVAGDVLLLVGLFLLGGNFWDKLQALFLHKAVVVADHPASP
jgi:hypothetical protein